MLAHPGLCDPPTTKDMECLICRFKCTLGYVRLQQSNRATPPERVREAEITNATAPYSANSRNVRSSQPPWTEPPPAKQRACQTPCTGQTIFAQIHGQTPRGSDATETHLNTSSIIRRCRAVEVLHTTQRSWLKFLWPRCV